ncbi:MAG TPA: Gfo/Idh/MocA family oxidoreductase, partial [Vicinamibacterales bacterium]|nr:Gfo/Idh/MocA family oxidoreductase [Vicinamibacterales bacterium]
MGRVGQVGRVKAFPHLPDRPYPSDRPSVVASRARDQPMISRRKFVSNVAATTAAVTIVPRHVLGQGFTPPSDRLNIAGIGVGGMGRTNLLNLGLDNNIVALCDVDWGFAGPGWSTDGFATALKREEERLVKVPLTPEARKNSEHRVASLKRIAAEDLARIKRYTDFRLMFEEQNDIDAVVVATPDHMHAPIAMAALDLGKH